jgi:hypothetical protein
MVQSSLGGNSPCLSLFHANVMLSDQPIDLLKQLADPLIIHMAKEADGQLRKTRGRGNEETPITANPANPQVLGLQLAQAQQGSVQGLIILAPRAAVDIEDKFAIIKATSPLSATPWSANPSH